MTEPSPAQQIFHRHLELLSDGRTEEWVGLFTPDGVLEYPFAPPGYPTSVTGQSALQSHMAVFLQNFQVSFDNVTFYDVVDPTIAIAELQGHGQQIATGAPYEQSYICIMHTAGGLITRFVDYWNPLAFTVDETADSSDSAH